jgi:hypothetical protein
MDLLLDDAEELERWLSGYGWRLDLLWWIRR